MSTFLPEPIACPSCGTVGEHLVAHSINAARRPALRGEIYQGQLHRFTCAGCGAPFRHEASFTYLDFERGQVLVTFPPEAAPRWRQAEAEAAALFDRTLAGPDVGAVVRELAAGLCLRVCFGHAAFREKVLCAALGVDDVRLERVKLGLVRADPLALPPTTPPRLIGEDDGGLVLAGPAGRLSLSRAALGAVADPDDELRRGPFVDLLRYLI